MLLGAYSSVAGSSIVSTVPVNAVVATVTSSNVVVNNGSIAVGDLTLEKEISSKRDLINNANRVVLKYM